MPVGGSGAGEDPDPHARPGGVSGGGAESGEAASGRPSANDALTMRRWRALPFGSPALAARKDELAPSDGSANPCARVLHGAGGGRECWNVGRR